MVPTASLNKQELTQQNIFFHLIYISAQVLWGYYLILLLRLSGNSIPLVFMAQGIASIGGMLGFLLSGMFLNKIGYLGMNRISNFVYLVSGLITLATISNALDVVLIISALNGLAAGFFWNTKHTYNIKEMNSIERSRIVSTLYSFDLILIIILPIMAGALISFTVSYQWIFLIISAIYLLGLMYPWKYNKTPRDTLNLVDLKTLSNRRGFKLWASTIIGDEILGNQRVMIVSLLPFLFIGNEFGVGVLGSALGIVSAAFVFLHRNDDLKKQIKFGYIGGIVISIFSVAFLAVWTLPALIIRELAVRFGLALFEPVSVGVDYKMQELFLGDFKEQYATEVVEYRELFLFIARMFNLLLFIVIFFVLQFNPWETIKVIFGISILRELVFFTIKLRLVKDLQR